MAPDEARVLIVAGAAVSLQRVPAAVEIDVNLP